MDPEKDTPKTPSEPSDNEQSHTEGEAQAPADALSRTPDELEQEAAEQATHEGQAVSPDSGEKKLSPLKKFFRRVNVYFLGFILVVIVAGAIAVVNFLNSQKAPAEPNINSQSLTSDTLKQLSNTDVSVGDTSQTLTIQGNAVIAGQGLIRGDLNVAGNIQSGGPIKAPSLTIAGDSNIGKTQADSLQVANSVAVQGSTTLRDLTVAGTSSFGGAITASQITASRLILSGNAVLQIPNHIAFTGPSPSPSTTPATLGNGGSASVSGSDTTGTININTGTSPQTGCFIRLTFNQEFTSQPHVIVSPINAGAGLTQYYVTRDTKGFSLCTATPAPGSQTFAFDYFVTN